MDLDKVFPHLFVPCCARKQEKALQYSWWVEWSLLPWQLSPVRRLEECDGRSVSWGSSPPGCEAGEVLPQRPVLGQQGKSCWKQGFLSGLPGPGV